MAAKTKGSSKNSVGKDTQSFETQLQRLEEVIKLLEMPELTIEESLKLYEEGVTLSNLCRKLLDEAKHTIRIYTDGALADFAVEEKD